MSDRPDFHELARRDPEHAALVATLLVQDLDRSIAAVEAENRRLRETLRVVREAVNGQP